MSLLNWVYLVFLPPALFTSCFYEHITDCYQMCGRTLWGLEPRNLRKRLLWLLLLPRAVSCFSSLSQRLHCLCWCAGKVQPPTLAVRNLTLNVLNEGPPFSYFWFGTPVTNLLHLLNGSYYFLCPVFYLSCSFFKKIFIFVYVWLCPVLVVAR